MVAITLYHFDKSLYFFIQREHEVVRGASVTLNNSRQSLLLTTEQLREENEKVRCGTMSVSGGMLQLATTVWGPGVSAGVKTCLLGGREVIEMVLAALDCVE